MGTLLPLEKARKDIDLIVFIHNQLGYTPKVEWDVTAVLDKVTCIEVKLKMGDLRYEQRTIFLDYIEEQVKEMLQKMVKKYYQDTLLPGPTQAARPSNMQIIPMVDFLCAIDAAIDAHRMINKTPNMLILNTTDAKDMADATCAYTNYTPYPGKPTVNRYRDLEVVKTDLMPRRKFKIITL
jgi:hypothetical protein